MPSELRNILFLALDAALSPPKGQDVVIASATGREDGAYATFLAEYAIAKGSAGEGRVLAKAALVGILNRETELKSPYLSHMRKLYDALDTTVKP